MSESADFERTDPGEPERDADRLFVDALLRHHYEGDRAASAQRIEAVLRAIDSAPRSARPPLRATGVWTRALRPVLAAAALIGLILIPSLLAPTLLSGTAAAAIERAATAMSRPVDLHYRLEILTPLGGPVRGKIWFRGADRTVMRLELFGGEVWAGEGRESAWSVPLQPRLPVRLHEKGALFEALKIQDGLTTPLLQISRLLEILRDGYELEFGEDLNTVEARRKARSAPGNLPERVTVRIGPDGFVRELEADWTPILGRRGARLTWIDGAELPDSFYEHAAHHELDREVVDLR